MDERKSISKEQAISIIALIKAGKIDCFETYQGFEESTYFRNDHFYVCVRNMNKREEKPVIYKISEKKLIKHIMDSPFFRFGYLLEEE